MRSAKVWLAAFAVLLLPLTAMAQGIIQGRVIDAATGEPIPGVNIVVRGLNIGTATSVEGRYEISRVPAGTRIVEARFLGYQTGVAEVAVANGQTRVVDFSLAESVFELDQVVVTGVPGGVQRRSLGNTVARVDASSVTDLIPVPSVQSLINGRAPGVAVMPGTGMVGGGSKIRIRGASSLSLSNEPLIYVDGIRVDNAQATGPAVQAFGSSVINRLNDFSPEEIESIEILKGPAAATLYGTEASNGVINIITKRGQVGRPMFSFTTRQGVNMFANMENRMYVNYWRNPATGAIESLNLATSERENGTPIFEPGWLSTYSMNVSGGAPNARYFVGAEYVNENGIEPTNNLERFSGRVNVTVLPTSTLEIITNLGYITSTTNLGQEAGRGGVTWGAYYSTPAHLAQNLPANAPPRRGYRSFTSDAYYAYTDFQDLSRFTGGVTINHRPFSWFSQRLAVGTDEVREDNQSFLEPDDYFRLFSAGVGYKDVSRRDRTSTTADYSGTVTLDITPKLSSSTSFGAQYYNSLTRFVSAFGEEFAVPGLRAVSAAARTTASETYFENISMGVFAQQQFNYENRLFVTLGLRADDNSAFGENYNLVYYPKASVAWVMSEEPFFRVPFVDQFRVRFAYGQTGKAPGAFDALRTYQAVAGPNNVGTVSPLSVGNPDLGPERGTEIEGGFELDVFNRMFGIELSAYRNTTNDAILVRNTAPSEGFPGLQFINVGSFYNQGVEVALRANPFSNSTANWDSRLSFSFNTSEVTDLGLDPNGNPLERIVVDQFFGVEHRKGYPLGSWFHVKYLSGDYVQNANGTQTFVRNSMMCEGLDGNPTRCYNDAGALIAPRVYLGTTMPKWEGAFSNTVTLFNRLRLYAQFDFKFGMEKFDNTYRVRCALFFVCRENVEPSFTEDRTRVAGYRAGPALGSQFISDAGFVKLREVSASYLVPNSLLRGTGLRAATLSVAARNLYTWSNWTGLEPETMFLSGGRGGFVAVEQNSIPQLAQITTTLNIRF